MEHSSDKRFIHSITRPASIIKGIGDQQAKRLRTYMARTRQINGQAELRDLLFHIPSDYIDRRTVVPLAQAREAIQTLKLRTLEHFPIARKSRGRPSPYRVQCEDDTGSILLVFFRGDTRYIAAQLPVGEEVLVSGELQRYNGMWQMTHPDIIMPLHRKDEICRLDPVYMATEGISSKMFMRWISSALEMTEPAPQWLPESTMKYHEWTGFNASLKQLHQPASPEQIAPARARLAYDEALAHQLALLLLRQSQKSSPARIIHTMEYPALPFALTEGQLTVLNEIAADMQSGERMIRLLQGDVGAGKTVIALLAALATVKCGYQAAIMAPTEILARQHLHSLDTLFGLLEVPVIFLAGSLTAKQRAQAHEEVATQKAAIIIGTHALFQEKVSFANLALAVIDEQHRFGVSQRLALGEKGLADGGYSPHLLLMTATPIPRSLNMAQYGDLDISLLTQKPAHRQPIDTRALPMSKLDELLEGLRRALDKGDKAYWVCPLVEEMEPQAMQLHWQAAEARYAELQLTFPGKVGMIHGRMSMAERAPVMEAFKRGDIRILVATTVIEVGVDVPDATIMIIENAERFGLAQLHQLRGRVGRGAKPSRCLLLYAGQLSATARKRLKTMRDTNDGFVIAEEDLRLRGGGDILGTRQTGIPDYLFLELPKDMMLLQSARREAQLALEQDRHLTSARGNALRDLLTLFRLNDAIRFLSSG